MNTELELAEAVRQACLSVALDAYQDGGISGLCAAGRWELAVQAIRCLDLQPLLEPGIGDDRRPTETG